ncbi:zinc metallopeptidase [Marinagarivorans algicola]|uniref:zinc metallopeptidase n=1 Tax=Marinagarivorans algicola TaxID=1513270 RepID=UPI0006B47A77|nr:zinc metallopeptidase [Marinagarivorans algicola]
MILLIVTVVLVLCSLLPQFWVRYTLYKYSTQLQGMPGTGGELAQHLIERFELTGVTLEQCTEGADHFDPQAKAVRLSPSYFEGKSLTAVAVAAHEVGHAIQYHRHERVSQLRAKYMPLSLKLQKAGTWVLMALPIIVAVGKAPGVFMAALALSVLLQLAGALMYWVVLPEEWDASFNKALPILTEDGYLPKEYHEPVRKILKAAALTYFAAALASLLNIGRWLMILRR